ncbi:MAG TPA: DUF4349 domain-containing protein [Candidatus Acidoferrum sp.]|jgi:hypothetical protein
MTFPASEPLVQTRQTNEKPPELEAAFIPLKKQSMSGEPKSRDLLMKRKFRTALLVVGAVAGLALVLVMVWGSRIAGGRMRQPLNAPSPQGSDFRDATRNKSIAQQQWSLNTVQKSQVPISARLEQQSEERFAAPMIARSVSLSIMAKDFKHARIAIEEILARHHGYAAELTVNTEQNNAPSLQASLRIPAGELAESLVELKLLGTVESESQKGEEVTQQHSDLLARLKNSNETEQRLQSILQERAGKMSDVLEVEQEISRVRGEIERMEAQQKALEHRVDFATVDLRIGEEYRAQLAAPSVANRFRNAMVTGFQDAADTMVAILLFAISYGPTVLLWLAILILPVRFLWNRSRAFLFREGR